MSIETRKKGIEKNINNIKKKIEIENLLIELENESIKNIKNNVSIENINTNIGKLSLNEINNKEIEKNINVNVDEISDEYYLKQRSKLSDVKFFKNIKSKLDSIPESNGSRYYNKLNYTIGIIADEFLMNSYNGAANFVYITPTNYEEFKNKLDVLLVVSTWKGLDRVWRGLANPASNRRQNAYDIINFFKSNGTKTVFYSKEDPVNYEKFVGLAKECEYIFTTCKEIIDKYKIECNNENVQALSFSVNPIYHNPIGFRKYDKINEVIFSGSWYEKYPHRIKDMRMLFDGVKESNHGLKIIDRNYSLNLRPHFFPMEYLEHVSPEVNHEYLQKLHKLFNWAINLNTIKDSYSMFANRIYELQANGNALISNYSVGVNNLFPNVFLINEQSEVKEIINNFDKKEVYEHQVAGIRRVMSTETCYERITELLNYIGIDAQHQTRSVLVVTKEINSELQEIFDKQSYNNKQLIEEKHLTKDIFNSYDFITFFSNEKTYSRYYLEDMINGFKYTDSDYITKDSYYNGNTLVKGIEHDYVSTIKDKYKTVFYSKTFEIDELLNMKENTPCKNGYSIDPFEFNNIKLQKKENKKEYKFSIIIPTYNNGDHLVNKCFNSLRRSSMFEEMEVIIVDDGSTDNKTDKLVEYLDEKYENVITYLYNDGGSGSASRPRNKGVEISTTQYITFLDPDNEAVNDGYATLYKEISKKYVDMVVGNMLKVDYNSSFFNYYNTVMVYNKSDIIQKGKPQFLAKSKFKAMSIQALMFRKDIVIKNNITQVLGAVGQDTLFFYELLLASNKVKVINDTIHIYYAAVEGSTVNNISKKYFEKAYIIENAKYEFFKKNNLLETYLSTRYETYFKNWYMAKLDKVAESNKEECKNIVLKLFKIYEKEIDLKDETIKAFIDSFKVIK